LWVAEQCYRLDGDFVECGVNRGFWSSAIMEYLRWGGRGKTFWLFDTFSGMVEEQLNETERRLIAVNEKTQSYEECFDHAVENFKEWEDVRLVRGVIPESLLLEDIREVAYLAIDLNCVIPEISAGDFFWNKMVSGGMCLLDDYAYYRYGEQKVAWDGFAVRHGVSILSLPTGQGLWIKP
jgi:hypothetical protein